MGGKRQFATPLLVAGASLATVAIGGFLFLRHRRSKRGCSANRIEASSLPQHHSLNSAVVLRPEHPDSEQAAIFSDEESFVIGHAPTDPSEPLAPMSLALLPPLKIVPSLKLMKENTDLHAASERVADAALSSSPSSDSSSERSTPRNPRIEHARIQQKLARVCDLLKEVARCFEAERRKSLDKMKRYGTSEGSPSSFEWLEGIRTLEQGLEKISLRSLVGVSRSTTLTTRLCAELIIEDSHTPVVCATNDNSDSKETIDKQDDDDSSFASNIHAVTDHLTSFGAFLFAKELIAQGQLGAQTKRLLFHAINQSPPIEEETLHRVLNNPKENSLVASVSFPIHLDRHIHEPWLWYLVGQVLEVQDGSIDVMASNSAVFELPDALRVAQRYFDVAYQPPYVAAYLMALATSAGNLGEAWMGLALSLGADDTISVFGQTFTSVDCLPQAIRCQGGSVHCTSFTVWTEAAALLEFASLSSTTRSNSPSGVGMTVTTSAHAPLIASADAPSITCESLTRRDCLIKAAALPEASGDASLWLQLGMLLNFGKQLSDHNELTIEEEVVHVGGMTVGRFDCYALSAAIEPSSSVLWYRVAVSLEDKPQMMMAIRNGVYAAVDAKAYERFLMGSACPPIDRETALLKAIKEDPDDSKVWFVLATTLFERNGALVQPESQQIRMPRYLLRRRQRSMDRVDSSVTSSAEGSPRINGGHFDDEQTSVSAEELFKRCIQAKPSLEPMVQKWIAKNKR